MTRNKVTTVDELADAACCQLPALSPEEQRTGIALLHELAKGEPVTILQLAEALGTTVSTTEALVKASALNPLIHADEGGRIMAFAGLTGTPTHHQLTVSGRKLWAWCAQDSLFIPELLGVTAEIESRDPETDELIRLTVSPARVEAVEPKGIVLSMRSPEKWDVTSASQIIVSACHFIFFFASRASGERWQAKHPATVLLSLDEAFALGKRINEHLFGAELARRKADRRTVTSSDMTTADELWEVARHHFPVVSQEEQRAGIALLRELARGEPVTLARLAQALGTPTATAEALTKESALSPFVHTDEEGRIQGFYGLSVTPTHHQITVRGRKLWAWCAPDTLEHPELLDDTAEVESRDPETGQSIRLTVSPAGVEAVEPKDVMVSWRRSELWDATSAAQIMASACHFHFFFASRESGERWTAKHPETFLLSLDEVFAFGKRANAHMFGAELARRRANAA